MLSEDLSEQVALAETWCAIGGRFNHPAALAHAKAVIEPLTTNEKTANDGWRLLARWAEASGDMPQAARAYRKLLEAQPDNADVQNNLAYALLEQGKAEDLAEARKLAEQAVAKSPASGTYLDTLARVHLKAGDLAAAEQAFQRALGASGHNLEAMIGLADVYARGKRTDKAGELLARINDALRPGENLPAALQRQLESVRQSVKGPVQSGRIE
jgi:Tfp pilus assembly protein PilF